MMSNVKSTPEGSPESDPKKPSTARVMIWVAVAGVGVYYIVNGIISIIMHG